MHQSWLQVLVLSPSTSCLFSSQYIILVAEKEASTKERKKRIRGKRHHKKKNKRYNTCCAQYSFRSYHLSSFTTFVRTVSLLFPSLFILIFSSHPQSLLFLSSSPFIACFWFCFDSLVGDWESQGKEITDDFSGRSILFRDCIFFVRWLFPPFLLHEEWLKHLQGKSDATSGSSFFLSFMVPEDTMSCKLWPLTLTFFSEPSFPYPDDSFMSKKHPQAILHLYPRWLLTDKTDTRRIKKSLGDHVPKGYMSRVRGWMTCCCFSLSLSISLIVQP